MSHAIKVVNLSEPSIKKALADSTINELRDPRYPVRLRFHKSRAVGSWYFVARVNNKDKWHKLGTWPNVKAKQVIDHVPVLTLNLNTTSLINSVNPLNQNNQVNPISIDEWVNVGQLLTWYCERSSRDSTLSIKRKRNIKSAIAKHLLPRLGDVELSQLDKTIIDELLIWPLQEHYALASVRQYFAVLKRAFSQAFKLNYITHDPVGNLSFTDFIATKIAPKGSKLAPQNLPLLLSEIKQAKPFHRALVTLMLMLGTRIGETRQLKWSMIDWDNLTLEIPAEITKTNTKNKLPLTDQVFALLNLHKLNQGLWGYRGDHLFSNPNKRGAIDENQANEWVKSVSQGNWSAHDLRKLARTLWADLGIDYMVSEQLLNHAMSKLDQAYIHTYLDTQKRQALETYHQYLDGINQQSIARPAQD